MPKNIKKKIILAFSGGLDTSFCVPYLIEKGYEVITASINTGGFTNKELKNISEKSKKLGATKHYEIDAQENLYTQIASYIIKANYLKGGVYPACVGPERNIIAAQIAKIAKQESTTIVAHGSTGAGNDQVRFDLALKALIPNCKIIAPIRDNDLTRTSEVNFLKKHGIKIEKNTQEYSINAGLLGITIGGKETTQTDKEVPESVFPNVKKIDETPNKAAMIKVTFKEGLPIKLNNNELTGPNILKKIEKIAALHGYGKDYHIGTTIIGLKGKIAFEAPAMKLLIKAHSELEKIVLTSKQIFWKNTLGNLYGNLIHEGLYFDPIVKNLEAFIDSANQHVTGDVDIKIYKGNITITSLKSQYSLFNNNIGTYGEETKGYNGIDAKGFCKLYGLESINAFLTNQK